MSSIKDTAAKLLVWNSLVLDPRKYKKNNDSPPFSKILQKFLHTFINNQKLISKNVGTPAFSPGLDNPIDVIFWSATEPVLTKKHVEWHFSVVWVMPSMGGISRVAIFAFFLFRNFSYFEWSQKSKYRQSLIWIVVQSGPMMVKLMLSPNRWLYSMIYLLYKTRWYLMIIEDC